MKYQIIILISLFFAANAITNYGCDSSSIPCLLYEWNFVNFTFADTESYNSYIQNQIYKLNVITSVKASKGGRMFVALPRWQVNKQGSSSPATFCEITTDQPSKNPLLKPYPSWELNQVVNNSQQAAQSNSLQSVLGFEIDDDILWILDQAQVGSGNFIENTIKLVKVNLTTDKIEYVHRFSKDIAGAGSMLNDLVIDKKNGFIYITDTGNFVPDNSNINGALISIDIRQEPYNVRRLLSGSFVTSNDPNYWITANGTKCLSTKKFRAGADGIAFSPKTENLVFCPLQSNKIYKVPSYLLRNFQIDEFQILNQVEELVQRNFASDGLVYGANGKLYFGSLEESAVYEYDEQTSSLQKIAQDSKVMTWIDTLGFDHDQSLIYTSDALQNFVNGLIQFDNPPSSFYRIYSINVGTKSYLEENFADAIQNI